MQRSSRSYTQYTIDDLSVITGISFMRACLLDSELLLVAGKANLKGSEWQQRPRGRPRTCKVPQGTA